MLSSADYKSYVANSVNYDTYIAQMAEGAVSYPDEKYREYIVMNQHRIQRLEKTYTPSTDIMRVVDSLDHPVRWLVITEYWCGDASQSLPVLHKIAEASKGKIQMHLVYRDKKPELMNAYLTNGSRSIPKVIQLNDSYQVTGVWGPRPKAAQDLVVQLKSNPETAADYANQLHLWYARDRQKAFEAEIADLLMKADLFATGAN